MYHGAPIMYNSFFVCLFSLFPNTPLMFTL